jgi:hypothetical protein
MPILLSDPPDLLVAAKEQGFRDRGTHDEPLIASLRLALWLAQRVRDRDVATAYAMGWNDCAEHRGKR